MAFAHKYKRIYIHNIHTHIYIYIYIYVHVKRQKQAGIKATDSYPEDFLQEWLHGLRRPFLSNFVQNS